MNEEDDDDFFGNDDTNNKFELLIEHRTTERLKKEMKTTGFRDGHQKEMENEHCLQFGFDLAYKLFSKLAFLIGQIRSLTVYLDVSKNDSAFLAQVLSKLDEIEKKTNYEIFLYWNEDKLNSDNLVNYLNSLESKLNLLIKEHFLNNFNKSNILVCLNNLDLIKVEASKDNNDQSETLESLNVDQRFKI